MTQNISIETLADIVAQRGGTARTITAIAGPPAAGKSTLAEKLAASLNAQKPGSAAVLGMDGFHFDDMLLVPRGLRPVKGAPQTFDVAGFHHLLQRLRANQEAEIAVPVFDRSIEIARAGAAMVPQGVTRLVVEGNYLLLDRAPWSHLKPLFDTTVLLTVSESVLRDRLLARWSGLP
ncbi:MAG TPA: nucleoside triphosphate hydrolase, partial [Rhizobiaceae bacterium]|nr:nucleoside triphosphate hydrolase [Rhizobiaceae bacterium]